MFSPLSSVDLLHFIFGCTFFSSLGNTPQRLAYTHSQLLDGLLGNAALMLAFVKICYACKDLFLCLLTSLCLLSTEAQTLSKVLIGCEVWWPISTVKDNFTLCALITV